MSILPYIAMDPEFTGEKLKAFVIALECAVSRHNAATTPLGRTVMIACEAACDGEKERTDATLDFTEGTRP